MRLRDDPLPAAISSMSTTVGLVVTELDEQQFGFDVPHDVSQSDRLPFSVSVVLPLIGKFTFDIELDGISSDVDVDAVIKPPVSKS